MVIERESGVDSPVEVLTRRSERARYVMIKNHVREVREEDNTSSSIQTRTEMKRKASVDGGAATVMREDLEELRRVYHKCKRLLSSIEEKYGRELSLLMDDGSTKDLNACNTCSCRQNKKIRFDESGSGVEVEQPTCAVAAGRLAVEHESAVRGPEDARALEAALRDETLCEVERRAAVDRMRRVRAARTDELRYERRALVQSLRADPCSHLAFRGTNLGALPGYAVTRSVSQN